ncbi:hypothetical protein M8818_004393 [Zalaria obscura]|uniref:Uncharacterized protein n=1 Tax=Zalaria obscura TaxID=2024903 RepID=A0ACC3SB02_9PEZI
MDDRIRHELPAGRLSRRAELLSGDKPLADPRSMFRTGLGISTKPSSPWRKVVGARHDRFENGDWTGLICLPESCATLGWHDGKGLVFRETNARRHDWIKPIEPVHPFSSSYRTLQ